MLALQDIARVQELLAISAMDTEVEHLCGPCNCSDKLYDGPYLRWGTNPGLQGERVPVRVPRVRDRETDTSGDLPQATQAPPWMSLS